MTAGEVFHDDAGELTDVREWLTWYPDDVWRYLLRCAWRRIGQEEAFVGRAAEVGDELGSRIVAARLARDLMRLGFLLERRYAPYAKWLGSAFARLDAAHEVRPALERALFVLSERQQIRLKPQRSGSLDPLPSREFLAQLPQSALKLHVRRGRR